MAADSNTASGIMQSLFWDAGVVTLPYMGEDHEDEAYEEPRARRLVADRLSELMASSPELENGPRVVAMAKRIGANLPNGTFQRVRKAENNWGIDVLDELSKVFGVPPHSLLLPADADTVRVSFVAEPPPALGPRDIVTRALRDLAQFFGGSDQTTRETLAPLLASLALHPEESSRICAAFSAFISASDFTSPHDDRLGRLFSHQGGYGGHPIVAQEKKKTGKQ